MFFFSFFFFFSDLDLNLLSHLLLQTITVYDIDANSYGSTERAMAESHRAHFVSLHVRMSNIAALRLYRDTLGFEVEKVESGYYADSEDAYAMRLNLQNMWLDWKAIEKKDADNNKEKNGDEEGNEDEGEEVGELGKKDAEKMIRVKVGRGLGVGDLVEKNESKA